MKKKYTIVGIDEAGRGPLAGPVVAASVIMEEEYFPNEINDSKKISEKKRDALYKIIIKKASQYGIGIVGPNEIDKSIDSGLDLDGSPIPLGMINLYREVMHKEGARKRSGVKKSMRN